jgi:hypothetical protein
MLESFVTRFNMVMVLLVCGFAIISGSWRERLCGALYLISYVMMLGFGLVSLDYASVYMTVADVLLVPGLWIIARRAPHPWAKCALAVQLVSVVVDIAAMSYDISQWWYFTIQIVTGYAFLICLLVGTFTARARRRSEKQASR